MKKHLTVTLSLVLTIIILLSGCGSLETDFSSSSSENLQTSIVDTNETSEATETEPSSTESTQVTKPTEQTTPDNDTITTENSPISLSSIPAYSGTPYVAINSNVPSFSSSELTTKSYEYYSNLDNLGRCGVVMACVGTDIMPTEERESIGQVKPTGWHTVKYDCVDGKYLYNRCHLIGYQLTGENANTKNLITGTRYMNVDGMLPFENMVADYVKETGNHVMYRVTPIFDGNNLLANGVQMEAFSVEDDGDGICFNIFVYNVQPQITINYANGDSSFDGTTSSEQTESNNNDDVSETYILNTNTKKFHYPECSSVSRMSDKNKETYNGSRDDLISKGYDPCGNCNP